LADIDRRSFLRLGLASAVGLPGLLAACTPAPASTAPPTTAAAGQSAFKLPAYVPFAGPPPDYPGSIDGIQPAYAKFPNPSNPVRSIQQVPGKGGEVSAMTTTITSPPPPLDQNPAWQAVNQEIGVTLRLNIVPSSDYVAKLSTVLAGNDLPDFIYINQGGTSPIPNILTFLQAKCADLTPYLAGDAIKTYPNLANFPTFNWKGAGTVYKGAIYGVPVPRSVLGSALFVHQEMLESIGAEQPKSADDFKRILLALTRPQQEQWGIAGTQTTAFHVPTLLLQVFGGPNQWRLEPSGKLTRDYETDEFKAAVGFARDLYVAGAYHPKSVTYTNLGADADFEAGKFGFYYSTWLALSTGYWPVAARINPAFKMRGVSPFSQDGKAKPVYFLGIGNFGNTYIKQATAERVQELLGILNYMAAPFGTHEQMLVSYGLPAADYTLDGNGNPVVTASGFQNNPVPFRYLTQYPAVQYNSVNSAEYARTVHAAELDFAAAGIQDPTVSAYSPSFANLNATLRQEMYDGISDIVAGRRPIGDLEAVVANWRSKGGDKIRAEFEQALQSG
jgi:putative aldouronate transport system substrate-binding protein